MKVQRAHVARKVWDAVLPAIDNITDETTPTEITRAVRFLLEEAKITLGEMQVAAEVFTGFAKGLMTDVEAARAAYAKREENHESPNVN